MNERVNVLIRSCCNQLFTINWSPSTYRPTEMSCPLIITVKARVRRPKGCKEPVWISHTNETKTSLVGHTHRAEILVPLLADPQVTPPPPPGHTPPLSGPNLTYICEDNAGSPAPIPVRSARFIVGILYKAVYHPPLAAGDTGTPFRWPTEKVQQGGKHTEKWGAEGINLHVNNRLVTVAIRPVATSCWYPGPTLWGFSSNEQ